MKESERLTTATYKYMTDKYKTATKKWEVSFQKVYDQLFAYEDTGLSPEEVERLKHECENKERAYNEEYQSRRILKEKNAILVKRLDEQCDTCPAFERLKAENAELRARLEKSERALKFACENNSSCCYPFKQLDENYIDECREDGSLCGKCLERWAQDKAEKEESIHDD